MNLNDLIFWKRGFGVYFLTAKHTKRVNCDGIDGEDQDNLQTETAKVVAPLMSFAQISGILALQF